MKKQKGEIVPLKDLFAKYKKTLIAPQKTIEVEIIRVVGECTGISLKEEQVKYQVGTRTVSFQVSGMIKQELKIKYHEILKEMRKRLGEKSSPLHIL